MPRKSNRLKNGASNFGFSVSKLISGKDTVEDCVYIGKENIQKWTELKSKLNFCSDHDFASFLLDLILNDKSTLSKKLFKNENEIRVSTSSGSGQNCPDNQELLSTSNIFPLDGNASHPENNSSVIVVNQAMRNEIYEDKICIPEEMANNTKHRVQISDQNSSCVVETQKNSAPSCQSREKSCSFKTNSFSLDVANVETNKNGNLEEIEPFSKDSDKLSEKSHITGNNTDRDENLKQPHINMKCNNTDFKMETKLRKQKKKKLNETKYKTASEDESIFKHRKRRIKNSENSSENSKEELPPNLVMDTARSAIQISTEDSNLRPSPVDTSSCERVAITIKLCTDCELHHIQDACPLRKPIGVVPDTITLHEWLGGQVKCDSIKNFAEASLPVCLELRVIDGKPDPVVVARENIEAFIQFGPLVGKPIKEMEIADDSTMEHIWELCDGTSCHYLSTNDTNFSNWLRFVHPAPVRSSRNLEVVLRNNQLFFITTTTINEGDELLFWAENTNTAWSHKKLCKTKCGGCNLSFSHTIYYRLHCAVFHDPSYSLTVRKYHCKVCGTSVLGKENIVKHAAEKHNGKGAYQCQYCNKFFLRLNYLEMHRTYGCSANPNRSRPLCDYCGRKFCQPQKLKVHIKRMHSEMLDVLRDFQCKHCLKILGSRAALQRHFKEVHQKDVVGAFTCDRCGKMFQNKSNLKIHMLTHSGIKPFKCKEPDCLAAFTTKQCLQFHYRKIHRLEEGSIPPIERSVEYTFDAYAGSRRPNSVNSDSQCSSDGEDTPEKYTNEPAPISPTISVTGDQISKSPLETFSKIVTSKGSKKWMGKSPVEDNSKPNVFDFEEDDKEQDINVSQIEEEPIPMLFNNCKPDSANASLLVEAALDAAERDIDIPSKLHSPVSLVTNKEAYPALRSHLPHSPLGLSRPVSPVEYPMQDQSQSPHLAMDSCYSTMSPRHPYSLMFPERTPHYDFRLSPPPAQIDTFHLEDSRYDHLRRTEENSNDEGVNVVQNLSLGLKNKSIPSDNPYKYDNLEERSFESVEGLDMSRTSNYHHSFVSVTPRYPPTLYEPRTYSHTDVLRVVNFSHSVDLSLPRSHHQLTSPINQSIIEPVRIISPPPPYQTYPLSTSPSPYSRPSHSPSYHHYNTTY